VARWQIIRSRPFNPQSTSRDAREAWAVDSRDRKTRAMQRVDVFQADFEHEAFPPECQEAIMTGGKSALRPYLDDERLPAVIFLTTHGIVPDRG
jgi:hypothetical protein